MTIFMHRGQSTTGPRYHSRFVAKWDTTQPGSANDTVVLPLVADGTYDFYIDWGDGNRDTISGYDQSEVTHQYNDTGIYTVQLVANDMVGWQFNDSGDDDKLVEIIEWGPLRFVSDDTNLFKGCSNLTLSTTSDPPFNADAAGMFQDCSSLTGIGGNIMYWDMSSVTGMNFMLAGCTNLDADLSNWDVSSIENAEGFMSGAGLSMSNYDRILSGWSSQSVQSGVNISFGDTKYSHVTGASYRDILTSAATGWIIIDGGSHMPPNPKFISTWDTRNQFNGVAGNNKIILPLRSNGTYDFYVDWGDGTDEDHITNYNSSDAAHTYSSPGIYTITISGTLIGWAFYPSTTDIGDTRTDMSDWGDINSYKDKLTCVHDWEALYFTPEATYQFHRSYNLTGVPTTIFNVPASGSVFQGLHQNDGLGIALSNNNMISGWDTSSITHMNSFISSLNRNVVGLNIDFEIGEWDVSNVTDMSAMLANNYEWNNGGSSSISGWDTSNVQNMYGVFFNCRAFNQPIGYWNTSSVTRIDSMFQVTPTSATMQFDQSLAGWDVSNITLATYFMYGMALSTANYNATLISWGAQSVQNGVNIDFGSSRYSIGAATSARQALVNQGWTITDGGQA